MTVKRKKADEVRALAQTMERQLNLIQRNLRQRLNAEFARGELTGPQRLVMTELVRGEGLSLKTLSARVSLAHSTVSGIVDRLVKQGLIVRTTQEGDRRVSLLVASPAVREFLEKSMPELSLHPLREALQKATREERELVRTGVETLARLLDASPPDTGS